MATVLNAKHILITRPHHQAIHLTTLIETSGSKAIAFPTITIAPANDQITLLQTLQTINQYDIVIFVSANAVHYSSQLLQQYWLSSNTHTLFAAIGPATANALEQLGFLIAIMPTTTFNSEALLTLPPLQQCLNKNILIVSGADGRQLLADTLQQRGASVTTAIAYQRQLPITTVKPLLQYWKKNGIDVIICSSRHSLKNLYTLLHEVKPLLLKTPLIVISEAMRTEALMLGWQTMPIIAANATDEAIFATLKLI